jgi:hypothetical protein
VRGVADVQDSRFDRLLALYKPKRQVRARLEVTLLPAIEENSLSESDAQRELGEVDAFCHVVRVFEDDAVYHIWGNPDPAREVEFVHGEMVLHDLVFIEKRLERIDKGLKKGKDERAEREKMLLGRFQESLEKGVTLRNVEVPADDEILIASYPFLTRKTCIVALNVADDAISDTSLRDQLSQRFGHLGVSFVQIAARAESEIAALDSPEERDAFMRDMGISEPALPLLHESQQDQRGELRTRRDHERPADRDHRRVEEGRGQEQDDARVRTSALPAGRLPGCRLVRPTPSRPISACGSRPAIMRRISLR